jgi:hypothetical protein
MNKIASPQDLRHELRTLLAYARTRAPSRARIASALSDLAERVAADTSDEMSPGERSEWKVITKNVDRATKGNTSLHARNIALKEIQSSLSTLAYMFKEQGQL